MMKSPEDDKPITQMMEESPFPWAPVELAPGFFTVMDAQGVEVPMFRLFAFAAKVTRAMATSRKGKANTVDG